MQRVLDFLFAVFGLVLGLPVFLLVLVMGFVDTGSPLFFQKRVGRYKRPFTLVTFRTMRKDTASVGNHLADASEATRVVPGRAAYRDIGRDNILLHCTAL